MVAQSRRVFISMGVPLLILLACQPTLPPAPTTANNGLALTFTAINQTLSARTATIPAITASATLSTEAAPSATDIPPTMVTNAPIIITATFDVIPPPRVPMVSVSTETNCRTGPGEVYDLIGSVPVGGKFLLMGKSTSTNYWIIQLPDGRACWLSGQYAVVEGNIGSLPEYAIPPIPISPTPIPTTPVPAIGSVTGTITDTWGSLVTNTTVIAQMSGRVSTTGSDGKYSFPNLPIGTEFITVETPSYDPEFRQVTLVSGAALVVDFVLGRGSPAGGPGRVEGRVLFNGGPAVGADVWVWPRGTETMTDSNGQYLMDPSCGRFLFLAQLGNLRGGVEVVISCPDPTGPEDATPTTTVAPDIVLLPR